MGELRQPGSLHATLGPGIPDPSPELNRLRSAGHHLPEVWGLSRRRFWAGYIMNVAECLVAREAA
jgi:hypothetical protein